MVGGWTDVDQGFGDVQEVGLDQAQVGDGMPGGGRLMDRLGSKVIHPQEDVEDGNADFSATLRRLSSMPLICFRHENRPAPRPGDPIGTIKSTAKWQEVVEYTMEPHPS